MIAAKFHDSNFVIFYFLKKKNNRLFLDISAILRICLNRNLMISAALKEYGVHRNDAPLVFD